MTGKNKKILIVEDDKNFLWILRQSVIAEEEKPDLILSDFLMPKMDGLEMATKIKKSGDNVPIVLLTNVIDVDFKEDIKRLGGCDYLVKSELSINDIVAKIKIKLG